MRERKVLIGSWLAESLTPFASRRLQALRDKFKLSDPLVAGAVAMHADVQEVFDGVAAFWELYRMKDDKRGASIHTADGHLRIVEAMRDAFLPDNAPSNAFDTRCNVLLKDHNDFLESPYAALVGL